MCECIEVIMCCIMSCMLNEAFLAVAVGSKEALLSLCKSSLHAKCYNIAILKAKQSCQIVI